MTQDRFRIGFRRYGMDECLEAFGDWLTKNPV
jgi:hypothetical protein